MKKTANYGLNLWEKTDRIQMEDFNADNAKIEAAILAANEAATAATANGLKIKTGYFTGDGTTGTRTYSLGVAPKLLFLRTTNDNLSALHEKGLIATENLCITLYSAGSSAPVVGAPGSPCTFTSDGFSLVLNSTIDRGLNVSGTNLYYWVLY